MSRTSRYSTTKTAPSDIPASGKYTRYNRETTDYDAFFDAQYLGSRDSMEAARDLVNEHVYDLEQSGMMYTATDLDAGSSIEEIAADMESMPAVTVTTWRQYFTFHAGSEMTEVMVGPHGGDGDKPGVELIIGGTCINDLPDHIITLADLRTLRDNLTALLNDARLHVACSLVAA